MNGEAKPESLLDRVANEIVTVDSYCDARNNYDSRTEGKNILLIGPEWEEDVKFKENTSDSASFELEVFLKDNKDLGLQWFFKEDEDKKCQRVVYTDWMENEEFSLDLLYEVELSLIQLQGHYTAFHG